MTRRLTFFSGKAGVGKTTMVRPGHRKSGPLLGAALATVVGVLVEVPVMLSVCRVCVATRHWFAPAPSRGTAAPTGEAAAR